MTSAFDLSGRVAVVTGGNRGIGLGMARGLANAGATVVVAARDVTRSEAAVAELAGAGPRAAAVELDVREPASVVAMAASVVERFGRLDVLLANAGTNIRKPPEQYTLEEWSTVLDINLRKPENEALLRQHYVMVHVNVGEKGITDNFDVAERYGIPLKKGVPALAVLEPDGRVVYAQKNGEFESMRSMDPRSVNDFLVKWKADGR